MYKIKAVEVILSRLREPRRRIQVVVKSADADGISGMREFMRRNSQMRPAHTTHIKYTCKARTNHV